MILRLTLLLVCLATPLAAQAPASSRDITAAEMLRRIEIVSDDSMLGRDTPSPGLERAAAYVSREFRRLGLRPAGEGGAYEQRWGISHWIPDTAQSRLELTAGSLRASVRLGRDARFVGGRTNGPEIAGEGWVIWGPLTREATADPRLEGRIVLLVLDYLRPLPVDLADRVDEIALRARAVLLVSNRDSASFARRILDAMEPQIAPDFRLERLAAPVLEVHERAVGPVLRAAGIATDSLRVGTRSGRRGSGIHIAVTLKRRTLRHDLVPNLLGVLEGRDSTLRAQYVVVSAHMDAVGLRPGAGDSINNGADDNASGLAGLLELAEAFHDPGSRPARSLLFLAPSGEEKGLWGSAHYVAHPTVPLRDMAALINMDLIGRNWTDSVIAVGSDFTTLGESLRRAAAAHPELRMWPLADRWPEERIFYRSDHYHFARRGVPILFFTSGTHPDYHQPTDSADRIDAGKAARLVQLLYYLIADIGNDPMRPRWSPARYREIVQGP
jgi:peptidase M28-like protein